jgi:hypothetical protein
MTIYSIDLDTVLRTIRTTLAERVAPAVESDTAALELAGVIEQLDNLGPRLAWSAEPLARTVAQTEELARRLGLGAATDDDGGIGAAVDGSADAAVLRRRRKEIAEVIDGAYAAGSTPGIVGAVLEFSETDVREQISIGMRRGLPDFGSDA